jgi:hypothetical protein
VFFSPSALRLYYDRLQVSYPEDNETRILKIMRLP